MKRRGCTAPILGFGFCLLVYPNVSHAALTPSGPITINGQNGTVISGMHITNPNGDCVTIINSPNITLQNSDIGPCGGRAISISGGSGNHIVDNYIHTEASGSFGCCDSHDNVFINGAANLLVQGNVIAYGETNVEVTNSNGVQVIGNFLLNPQNHGSRGENVQFWGGNQNATVKNNYALSSTSSQYLMPEIQEDSINFGDTNGILVQGNYVQGGHSASGCGIITDYNANNAQFLDNTVVDSGQAGINIANGTNQVVSGNRVFLHIPIAGGGNTALEVWNEYTPACGPVSMTNNIAYGVKPDGTISSWWNGGGCEPVTFSGNTLDGAAYNALTPVATKLPPPAIPPMPFSCTAVSPYTNNTSVASCAGGTGPPAPVITPSADNRTATVSLAFSYTINASNSPTSYGAVIQGGTGVPAGLSLSGATLSGTPTQAGTFTIDLSATNSGGTGTATLMLTVSPPNGAGAINLTGTDSTTTNAIGLQWQISGTVTGFKIMRKATQMTAGFAQVGQVGPTVTSFTDPGLNYLWQYDYQVVATNSSGDTPPSNTITVQNMVQGPMCDVNGDGVTNVVDVQQEVNAALGAITCSPTYDINKDGLCNVIDVQRVTNAALGGACVSP